MFTPPLVGHGHHVDMPLALPDEHGRLFDKIASGSEEGELFSKSTRASDNPGALGWIRAVYEDAIEYTSVVKQLRGLPFFWAIFGGLGMGLTFLGCGIWVMSMGAPNDLFPWFAGTIAIIGSLAFGTYVFVSMLRTELFRPSDLPIAFDRKKRKVYRILRQERPGFAGLFQRWPIIAHEYNWDLIDAEHRMQTFTTGATIHINHFLVFVVRDEASSAVLETFQIGSANVLNAASAAEMWEHIRRFMEEGGPRLPSPVEPLADTTPTQSFRESMRAVSPFGPRYADTWCNAPLYALFMHLILPVTFPLFLLWGIGNYLSYRTAVPVAWPTKISTALGRQRPLR